MLGLDHPFFRHAWRRHLAVAVCILWGIFELATGAVFWAVLFIGIGLVAAWGFLQIDWSKYNDDGAN